nr:thioesterase family protein [Amylibacter sp.]
MPDLHPFDVATSLVEKEAGRWSGQPSVEYANMVGSFGGVTTATVLNAVLQDARFLGDPVSMTINLLSAMGPSGFEVSSKLCRTGKYTQHWSLELEQEGKLCATATVVCGVRGDVFAHQSVQMPDVPPADGIAPMDGRGALKWLDRYDFRFVEGAPAWTGKPNDGLGSARTAVWVGDNPPRPLDHLSLAALSDSFFLRLLHVRGTMEPMGSVSITTHFLASRADLAAQGSQPVLGVADATRFQGNFHDQQMQLWSTDGKILATGTQLVWYRQ